VYSPSTLNDFIWWSGWSVTRASQVFTCVQHQLVKADIQGYVPSGANTTFFMSKEFQKKLEEIDDEEPIVMARFLPGGDALLSAYNLTRNRFYGLEDNFLEDDHGDIRPTVWLNGSIIGYWLWTNAEMIVLLTHLDKDIVEQLKPEAEIVKKFIGAKKIVWKKMNEHENATNSREKWNPSENTTNSGGKWNPSENTTNSGGKWNPSENTTNSRGKWKPSGNTTISRGKWNPSEYATNSRGKWNPSENTTSSRGKRKPSENTSCG